MAETPKRAWEQLNTRQTVLFLGSGFSIPAINKTGNGFLTGEGLNRDLCAALGESFDPTVGLADRAGDFLPDRLPLLYDTLSPRMMARQIDTDQAFVATRPWKRIYTTNYDDVAETALLQAGIPYEPITFHDPLAKQKNKRQVVHLHGDIHRCDGRNIDEELVLTQASYVRQQAMTRPWFEQFTNDIRFADAVVFVGYSLSDVPVTALLLAHEDSAAKTSFSSGANRAPAIAGTLSVMAPFARLRWTGSPTTCARSRPCQNRRKAAISGPLQISGPARTRRSMTVRPRSKCAICFSMETSNPGYRCGIGLPPTISPPGWSRSMTRSVRWLMPARWWCTAAPATASRSLPKS